MNTRYTTPTYPQHEDTQDTPLVAPLRQPITELVSQMFPDREALNHVYLIEECVIDRNILNHQQYLPNTTQEIATLILAAGCPEELLVVSGSDDYLNQMVILAHDHLTVVTPRDNFIHRVTTRATRFSREPNLISNNERLTGSILRETKSQLSKILLNLSNDNHVNTGE